MMLLARMEKKHQLGFSVFFFLYPIEKSGGIHANFQLVKTVGGTSLIAAVIHYSDIQTCDNGLRFDRQI